MSCRLNYSVFKATTSFKALKSYIYFFFKFMPTSNLGSAYRAKIHLADCWSCDPALTSRVFTAGWSAPWRWVLGMAARMQLWTPVPALQTALAQHAGRQKAKITSCTGGKGCCACCSLISLRWLGWQHFWEALICDGAVRAHLCSDGGPRSSPSTAGTGSDGLCSSPWFTAQECLVDIPTEPADCGCCSHSQQCEDSCFSR